MEQDELNRICKDLIDKVIKSGEAFTASLRTTSKEPISFDRLLICGMGGSGISGDYIKKLAEQTSFKRIVVNKDYDLPQFLDNSWTTIVISYSGNTEETISCFSQLIENGFSPICISSNGKLQQFSKENNLRYISVPTGIAPRAAFPYLLGSLYGLVANDLGLPIPNPDEERLLELSSQLENIEELDQFAQNLIGHFPLIVHSKHLSNVGLRFRCQLNENSKLSAANYTVPEYNHNGIVGFDGIDGKDRALILLRTPFEHERTVIHLDFLRDDLKNVGLIHEFFATGSSILEQQLALTWCLDYISIRLAQLQGINPLTVPSIIELKSKLRTM